MPDKSRHIGAATVLYVTIAAICCLAALQSVAAKKCPVQFPNVCGCTDKACARCKECPDNRKVRMKRVKGKLVVDDAKAQGPPGRHLLGLSSPLATDISGIHEQLEGIMPGRTLTVQSSTDDLVCDGQRNTLVVPRPPYPQAFPTVTPYNSPDSAVCSRPSGGSTQCANLASVRCGNITGIGPVSFGTPFLVLPPTNPLRFTTTGMKFITYVEWEVYDVGTGGARLKGNYPAGASEVNEHVWEAPPAVPGDLCGTCTNCEQNKGIKKLSVTAQAGTGFRTFDLSQVTESPLCGQSCFDLDASYWKGMTYSCVEPTCGDTNLTLSGLQRFECPADFLFNDNATDSKNVTRDICCTP
eukprot:gene9106-9275_t